MSGQRNENIGCGGKCVLVSGCLVIELRFLSHLRWVLDGCWLQKRIVSRYGRGFLSTGKSIRSEILLVSVDSDGALPVFLETELADVAGPSQSLLTQA